MWYWPISQNRRAKQPENGSGKRRNLKILIACEFSGAVRRAFRERGHDAWSLDILPAADGSKFHIVGDAWDALLPYTYQWDMMIAFPPCTRLAVSGARWWKYKRAEQIQAIDLFMLFANADIPKIAIENPIGLMSSRWRKPDQIIQPWQFGHGETKGTCLWLKGLPLLQPSNIVDGRVPRVHYESPGIKNGLTRQQRRSITYPGIATAFAEQWG